jgi:ABC-type uncharacterized transport system substrate-binding protein
MLDPITLATVTSAITVLGTKVVEGVASEVGKSLWAGVKNVFGWNNEPKAAEIAQCTAQHLQDHPDHASQVIQLLQQDKGTVGMLVGQIDAEKVVVAHKIDTVNM